MPQSYPTETPDANDFPEQTVQQTEEYQYYEPYVQPGYEVPDYYNEHLQSQVQNYEPEALGESQKHGESENHLEDNEESELPGESNTDEVAQIAEVAESAAAEEVDFFA